MSVGSYYPYKAYLDSYDAMDSDATSNIGFDQRYKWMSKGNMVFLEGPIRMDICQQKRSIVNDIRIRMKLYQHKEVSPAMVVAHEERMSKHCAVYPFWKLDLKASNIEKGSYGWSADDVYHRSIPSKIKMVLSSGSTFNGNYAEITFNFKNYQLNFAEVMVDGVSIPSQAGDFSEAYWTLMEWSSHIYVNSDCPRDSLLNIEIKKLTKFSYGLFFLAIIPFSLIRIVGGYHIIYRYETRSINNGVRDV